MELEEYEESLKDYRDLKNSIDMAREEWEIIGEERGEIKKANHVAEVMLKNGEDDQKTAQYSGLSLKEIKALRNKLNL